MGMNALSEHEADIAIANALMMAAAVVFESTYQLPKDSIALEFGVVVRRAVIDWILQFAHLAVARNLILIPAADPAPNLANVANCFSEVFALFRWKQSLSC
jgi:hypothetical protein